MRITQRIQVIKSSTSWYRSWKLTKSGLPNKNILVTEPKEGQSRPSNNKWWVMALIMNVSVPQQKLAYANITKTDVYAVNNTI